jgi:hypothetical protein
MGGFDHIETAIRVRDIIKRAANKEAQSVAPGPLVGRMMSVDLPRLRGTVWLPNDEQPIQVNIFASAIPAEWQHKNVNANEDFDSTQGRGALVTIERLNDALWVTHILTGSTSALDLRALGFSVVEQNGAPTSAGGPSADAIVDIAGDPSETFINCRLIDTTILPGEALEFGPFTTINPGTPGAGYMEMTVKLGSAQKAYRFVADPANEFDNPYYSAVNAIWFRLTADHELTTSTWSGNTATFTDFDVDISFKKTAYGNDPAFGDFKEMWFRIIRRSSGTGMDAKVTLRATNIQKGRSLGGRELFMQEKVSSPGIFWGILGFHGANHGFTKNQFFTYDVFNRITSGDWGQSNTQVAYISNAGTTTNYSVNGQTGVITISANNTRYHQRQNESRTNFDGTMLVKPGRVATGASIRMGFMTNFDAGTSNCWMFAIEFQTTGTVRATIEKRIAGVISGAVSLSGQTYTATTRMRIRFQTLNNGTAQTYRMKLWEFGFREPEAWTLTWTQTESRAAGTWGVYAQADTGNTNTKNFDVTFEDIQVNTNFGTQPLNGHGTDWHTGPWRSGILRMANDLQKSWVLDGDFQVQDFGFIYVRWTGKIWLDGIGSHRNALHNGRAYLEIPSESGAFDVKVFPGGGLVSIDPFFGFGLGPGQSIWVGVPPECGFDNLIYNVFYVDGTILQDYMLPEWAVMIASYVSSGLTSVGPRIRLGNGDLMDPWRVPTFGSGWSNYGSGFDGIGYRKEQSGIVRLKGLVKNTTATATNAIFTLPVGFRPTGGDKIFTIQSSQATSTGITRLDVKSASGDVTPGFHFSGGGAGFLSLEGVAFNVN